jgi:dihydrofolate reductase/chitodextrinase
VHLAMTYDGTNLKYYLNGALLNTTTQTGTIVTSTNVLMIGGDTIYGQYFAGLIDEVRVYNIALTQAQIQSDMNTAVGPPVPDTTPPTAPANLTATAVSGSQVNLTWTASTDNVGVTGYLLERCTGASCSTFAQIATPTVTSYSDTGLSSATSYSYRVRATDAASNLSGYSNVASATTTAPDTQAPTAPSNLTATAISGNQINLAWTASTDNVGVTGYLLERCTGASCSTFAQIATPAATSYSDTGLIASTSYSYRVRATDAASNLSAYSNVASATTSAVSGNPNLVAAYSFNEGSGTTVADSSGNNNTGTLVSATWSTAGKFGNALSFNGTNARVNIPDAASLHLTAGFTLEAWVNPSSAPSGWRDIVYKPNDNYFLEASTNTNLPGGGVSLTNGQEPLVSGGSRLAANTWVHLAMTYDGTNLKYYLNGALLNTTTQTGTIVTSTNALMIGGDTIYGQYFAGLIDEVRVYNIALTQAQIQSDMNAALP